MKRGGFTLLEVMIGAAVLIVALLGLLGVFTGCFGLNETAKNLTIAINGAQAEMERIRNLPFNQISAQDGSPFEITGIADANSEGIVEVNNSNPDLLIVTATVCWRQGRNRIIGEDINLNGNLDAGEDLNPANGSLDSPAQLVTLITEKGQ